MAREHQAEYERGAKLIEEELEDLKRQAARLKFEEAALASRAQHLELWQLRHLRDVTPEHRERNKYTLELK